MRKAMLDFSRCMRENGIDMPDPKFEGGRVTMQVGGPGKEIDPAKMQVAEKACAKYRDAVKPPEMSEEKQAEFKKEALANARCMREHGIDMPDPTFDENGGARVELGRGHEPGVREVQEGRRRRAARQGGIGAGTTDVQRGRREMKRLAAGGAVAAALVAAGVIVAGGEAPSRAARAARTVARDRRRRAARPRRPREHRRARSATPTWARSPPASRAR